MNNLNQTARYAQTGQRLTKRISLMLASALLGLSQQALAHVEYYDLNQFAQITDLTQAGKTASTAQYGDGTGTPDAVRALNQTILKQLDLPLNDPAKWNGTYQSYTGVGKWNRDNNGDGAPIPGQGLYDPVTGYGTATVDVNDVTSFGWYHGTRPNLGDSHKVDWFNFRLYQTARVTITWNIDKTLAGTKYYFDSGFTLYKGVLTYQGHDQANEPLNPDNGLIFIQNPLDANPAAVDVQGIASAYRDTVTEPPSGVAGTYVGQFNALANWGQSNVAGNWSNTEYKQAVNLKNPVSGKSADPADTLETLTIVLPPGNYIIGASGADSVGTQRENMHGRLTFSAVDVACP